MVILYIQSAIMSRKRNRAVNWDEEEKQLFLNVLRDHATIIEDKSFNTNTNKIKTKAWEEVHKKFNGLNNRRRELSQLKIQWKTMKVNARKTLNTFKKQVIKTGGGARPATPDDAVIEVTDLLNPAELLRDHNTYDLDGLGIPSLSEDVVLENSNEKCGVNMQDVNIVTIEDVDAQVDVQEFCPSKKSHDDSMEATPLNTKMEKITTKKEPKCKLILKSTPVSPSKVKTAPKCKFLRNNTPDRALKSRKDHHYVSSIISHTKKLKDEEHKRRMEMAEEEHKRRMEMAEEEHAIKMAIHKDNLKFTKLIHEENLKRAIFDCKMTEEKYMKRN